MYKIIKEIIMETGIPPHLKGYEFILRAIELLVEDRSRLFNLQKLVYDPIARENHTTSTRVERDIRNAIEVAFTRNIQEKGYRYFRYIGLNKGKPINREYLAIIANEIIVR